MDQQQQPGTPWNPPVPGTTWQPGTAVPGVIPEVPLTPLGSEPKRKGRRAVAFGAAAALVAAGGFAMVQVAGNRDQGGAATPADAVEQLVAAINNQDVLGAMDVMLPGERQTFKQPIIDMVGELRRLEVLDSTARLEAVGGADFEITLASDLETVNAADDIVTVKAAGTAKADLDASKIPIGDFLIENAFDGKRPNDTNSTSSEFGGDAGNPVPITTVKRDGRWYVSLWYSVAEAARQSADVALPSRDEAIKPIGADSPEEAVGQMIEAIASFDLKAVIAGMNPNEMEALQRYAPIFLSDGQDTVDGFISDAGAKVKVDNLTYGVAKDGNDATVNVKTLTISGDFDGGQMSMVYDGKCVTVETTAADGEPTSNKTCDDQTNTQLGDAGLGFLARATRDAGLRVSQVGGKWYVSPFGTLTHSAVTVLKSLKKADLQDLVDNLGSFAQTASDQLGVDVPGLLPQDDPFATVVLPINPDDPTFDTVPADTGATTPIDPTDTSGALDDFPTDASTACYSESDYSLAAACFQAGLTAGTITADQVPVTMRFPECGLAEAYWTGYYQYSDADFIALVTKSAPCFTDKVATGVITEYEVPFEVVKPECYAGVNPYAIADTDASTAAFDAYASCASA